MMIRLAVILALCLTLPARGEEQSTPARAALVIDVTSGAVLLDKASDVPMPPASMSKLMTLYMVFEALEAGRIALNDTFRISDRASKMGGSKMFLRAGEAVRIEDLIRGVIVQSGNDAAVALAEALSGTEEAFAALMTARAPQIGLRESHFANATGWPAPGQHMSVRDLAQLAVLLITRFPEQYRYFAETEFTWDGIRQENRNPLLALGLGADGLKTGHTEEAGFGLVASAKRGDRRVVLVVSGLDTSEARRQESERLINWAFRAFDTQRLYQAGQPLAQAGVWIGAADQVALVPAADVIVTVPYGRMDSVAVTLTYDGPIPAPIAAGAPLGAIEIAVPGMAPQRVALVAAQTVEAGGLIARLKAAAHLMLRSILPGAEG